LANTCLTGIMGDYHLSSSHKFKKDDHDKNTYFCINRNNLASKRMRPHLMSRRYQNCLRLNARVIQLAGAGKWINSKNVAESYDALAPQYEQNWLNYLSPVTDHLLEQVPVIKTGRILDLGCGTGYSTAVLSQKNPTAEIRAQDISEQMLLIAKEQIPSVNFICNDMLDFMKKQPTASAKLVVSTWAIGYSNPQAIFKESSRVLLPGGRFAFVVNLKDTLRPVHIAFRKTMQQHPSKVRAVVWPRFPSSWKQLNRQALACGLNSTWNHAGEIEASHSNDISLEWLFNTGILAGFDAMLPFADDPELVDSFNRFLREQNEALKHHYIMAVLEKR